MPTSKIGKNAALTKRAMFSFPIMPEWGLLSWLIFFIVIVLLSLNERDRRPSLG
jgi:hypothetical protein